MRNIVYVCALFIMGCAPSSPEDYCNHHEAAIRRYQPCVDIAPACEIERWQAVRLQEAKEYIASHCEFYG